MFEAARMTILSAFFKLSVLAARADQICCRGGRGPEGWLVVVEGEACSLPSL